MSSRGMPSPALLVPTVRDAPTWRGAGGCGPLSAKMRCGRSQRERHHPNSARLRFVQEGSTTLNPISFEPGDPEWHTLVFQRLPRARKRMSWIFNGFWRPDRPTDCGLLAQVGCVTMPTTGQCGNRERGLLLRRAVTEGCCHKRSVSCRSVSTTALSRKPREHGRINVEVLDALPAAPARQRSLRHGPFVARVTSEPFVTPIPGGNNYIRLSMHRPSHPTPLRSLSFSQ
jgi:hypothetical protein